MKSYILASITLFVLQCAVEAQRAPNTRAPMPIQVMGEGRLENLQPGTTLNKNNISNLFKGWWQTNGTWDMYTNGGATAPTIQTALASEDKYGFYIPTVSSPTNMPASNHNFYYDCALGGDVCPQFTITSSLRPTVMVIGFTITVSNWTGSTFRGYDTVRMGQSPYVICQFNDDPSQFPQAGPNGNIVLVHTPDGAGVGGGVVVFDNNEIYDCMMLRDGPNTAAALSVYQRVSGSYKFVGESRLGLTTNGGSPAVENIFFGQNDDHSPASGTPGKIRLSNFWMTTNREAYYNRQFPTY